MEPKEIKDSLKDLIVEARPLYPKLADKLDNLQRWIKNKKDGQLRNKKYVRYILFQLIADVETFLAINDYSLQEDRHEIIKDLSRSEMYWYETLFPQWFMKEDKYLPTWKEKLMADEFTDDDEEYRKQLIKLIKQQNGGTCWRYILDLAMATDMVINSNTGHPICVQYTTNAKEHTKDKIADWNKIIFYYNINRAIFVHFNPKDIDNSLIKLVMCSLHASNYLPNDCRRVYNVD